MKKLKYLIGIIVISIIVIIGIEFFRKDEIEENTTKNTNVENISNNTESNNTKQNTIKEETVKKEEIKTGEELMQKAEKTLSARGWAGASNNVIGLKDGIIYYYNKGTGEIKKVATGIEDIYYNEDNPEQIIAKQGNNVQKFEENIQYLIYK